MKSGFVTVDNNIFETLLAVSYEEQITGLMHKKPPVPNMVFIYKSAKINKFWMKNTPTELDIIFCCNGIVTEICKGIPNSTASIGSNLYSDMVIEFPFGTASKCGIMVGSSVTITK